MPGKGAVTSEPQLSDACFEPRPLAASTDDSQSVASSRKVEASWFVTGQGIRPEFARAVLRLL